MNRRRAVVSYTRGLHMPRPRRNDQRYCADCGRRLIRYTTKQGQPSLRHQFARDYAHEWRLELAQRTRAATMQEQEHEHGC